MTMDSKQRLVNLIKEVAFVAGILAANAIIYAITGYGIPCVFRLVTGLKCPGCGLTHAYLELFKGNIHGAIRQNVLSITLMPVLFLYLLIKAIIFVKTGSRRTSIPEYIFYTICLITLMLFFIYRNFIFNH